MSGSHRPPAALLLACALLLSVAGCWSPGPTELNRRIKQLEEAVADRDRQLAALQTTIDEQRKRINEIRAFKPEDLERTFYPEKIVIASLSGGDDYDGQPGDDGITVHLRPVDRDGDAVKVAGDIRIELYDLANPPDQNLVGVYEVPVDRVREHWYGKLATYHYTIRCPWPKDPPRHDEITIRAVFRDYLTQRVMTAQSVCRVKLPPAAP